MPYGRFNAAAQFNIHFFHPIKDGVVRDGSAADVLRLRAGAVVKARRRP